MCTRVYHTHIVRAFLSVESDCISCDLSDFSLGKQSFLVFRRLFHLLVFLFAHQFIWSLVCSQILAVYFNLQCHPMKNRFFILALDIALAIFIYLSFFILPEGKQVFNMHGCICE